jgi:hypothetical protein
MSEYAKFATSAGDQFLASISEMQDAFLKSMTPFTQAAATMPKMPASGFMPEMPTMAEITEANFSFANKLLKQQKKFAEKFFAVTMSAPEES